MLTSIAVSSPRINAMPSQVPVTDKCGVSKQTAEDSWWNTITVCLSGDVMFLLT